jgi:hypothetical protein
MVHGNVAPGFEPVRDAFERCFAEEGESGASFAALLDGRLVVDLCKMASPPARNSQDPAILDTGARSLRRQLESMRRSGGER